MRPVHALSAALFTTFVFTAPALAATCNPPGGFNAFIAEIRKEAAAKGISQRGLSALNGIELDPGVLAADRRQGVFKQTFEQFSGRMISRDRMTKGLRHMQTYDAVLRKIEQRFGVPGAMLIAIWGLETDYGTNTGKLEVIRSVATLAFDCRRTDMFQAQLLDALRIVDKGDLRPADMRGHWAGEIGQTQFLPSSYFKFAIDFDGDGRRDLIRSVPDVLASTANYLQGHGWQRGQRWNEGDPNFDAVRSWNKALVYAKTIAAFAERLEANNAQASQPRR
ncbi:MAG: lytic murein transglycosylase [Alphaproteobacteria bacterium]|nr:lytic murein transglycosylase [Alphaproteobacteria bacterium]